jgi:vitamin B12/bleomycin/antimicrobial peptide transport system ATP-binding/permease protein
MTYRSPPDLKYREVEGLRGHFKTPMRQLFLPYWKSDERWFSGLLAIFIVAISFTNVYIGVWRNGWTGTFYDAVGAGRFSQMFPLLSTYLGILMASTAGVLMAYVALEVLSLRWRTWLTNYLIDRWTTEGTYFRIERDKLLDNADQRIAEDANLFIKSTLSLFFQSTQMPTLIVTYSVLLWKLSGNYTLHLGGHQLVIPAYMVITVFLFSGTTLLLTHLVGRRLIPFNVRQQKVEADFRALLLQIREGSEQIAFYQGSQTEAARLKRTFLAIRENTWRMICITRDVMFCTQLPGQITAILPALMVMPQLSSGAMTLGGLMKVSGAFVSLEGGLAFFPQAYQAFAAWRAVVRRLLALLDAVEPTPLVRSLSRKVRDDAAISVGELTLLSAEGAVLSQISPFHLEKGARCMIRGRSGAGKSTLLRAIAGIWPYGDGTVGIPGDGASMMFVPQKSYVPVGTLKQALAYPSAEDEITDADALRALADCGLTKYQPCLDEIDRWGNRLSGGEQQRLAFARVLLKRPTHIFLDEATSALDEISERVIYSMLIDALPTSTLVSVAHRKEVAEFHNQFVDLLAPQTRQWTPSSIGPGTWQEPMAMQN